MKEAMFYTKVEDKVQCQLCPHQCVIAQGKRGICGVRINTAGVLYTQNYGLISTLHLDPIEKKPLRDFMPGTMTLSLGSFGCNFKCDFCQNYEISMATPETRRYSPEGIVNLAIEKGYPSISYTYNEPTVFYEFMYETAVIARKKGLKNIIVTNGYISPAPLNQLLPFIDAMNIDLKTYDEALYQTVCGGQPAAVIETIKSASHHCHVEVTVLIVPRFSDDLTKMEGLFQDLQRSAPEISLHLSRYFPRYKRSDEATSLALLMEMKAVASRYFDKVYIGNV